MRESFWGAMVIMIGASAIVFIFFFQTITNTDQQNYTLLKETTEAAMVDALDIASYRATGDIRIDREKFVENFIRRFAGNVSLSSSYEIYFYDINETPPKVSLEVISTKKANITGKKNDILTFDVRNKLSSILETPY